MIDLRCGDCTQILKELDDNSIDLTVTSPPYDDLRNYDSNVDYDIVAQELYRVTKDGGVVVWNVNDRVKDGSKTLSSFKQALIFHQAGFNVNDVMIWEKTNPMPQVKQPRYTQCFEYMFIFSKGKPKTFNPIMVECKSAGQVYNSTCKKISGDKERVHKNFTINKEKVESNIWKFAISQNKTAHPAVFPIELPLRHIKSWSNEEDIVLDPFMGSGTTGLACLQLNRQFIGIECNKEYFDIAEQRIKGN